MYCSEMDEDVPKMTRTVTARIKLASQQPIGTTMSLHVSTAIHAPMPCVLESAKATRDGEWNVVLEVHGTTARFPVGAKLLIEVAKPGMITVVARGQVT